MRSAVAVVSLFVVACSPPPPPIHSPPTPPPAVDPAPSSPETLVPGSNDFDLVNLAVDARFAYWGHRGGEKGIIKVPFSGGLPVTLVPGSEAAVTSLAADAKYIYFTSGRHVETESTEPPPQPGVKRVGHFEGVVSRVPKEGSSKIDEISSGRFKPEDVAVDGTYAYWIMSKRDATLVRQPLGQIDAPEVVVHGHFSPGSLVVAAGYAYWIDPEAGPALMRVSIRGGAPQLIAQGTAGAPMHPVHLAVDGAAVYVSDTGPTEGKGSVLRFPLGAGAPSKVAENLATPRAVAVHGDSVYWLNKGTTDKNFKDGSLEKAPAAGGAKSTMATALAAPDLLAVSDTRVVWTEIDGAVRDMGK